MFEPVEPTVRLADRVANLHQDLFCSVTHEHLSIIAGGSQRTFSIPRAAANRAKPAVPLVRRPPPSGHPAAARIDSADPMSDGQVTITLPDGGSKQVPAGTTVADFVRTQIGTGLAKAALFAKY